VTGFHVDPDELDAHAAAVRAVGQDVGSGAAAEVTGTAQADFGVLIGNTLGFGIRALAEHATTALRATGRALDATADQLQDTADTYRHAEQLAQQGVTGTEGGS
jgi:hypothetical protein